MVIFLKTLFYNLTWYICRNSRTMYVGGTIVGADSNKDLCTGDKCFMIIGLKNGTPYIVNQNL